MKEPQFWKLVNFKITSICIYISFWKNSSDKNLPFFARQAWKKNSLSFISFWIKTKFIELVNTIKM